MSKRKTKRDQLRTIHAIICWVDDNDIFHVREKITKGGIAISTEQTKKVEANVQA